MKSIIEEASSISKAIDQAWQRAGKPQEFTVKVFEEAQRNLFGLTVRSAKIALFFSEKAVAVGSPIQQKSKPTGRQHKQTNQNSKVSKFAEKSGPKRNAQTPAPKKNTKKERAKHPTKPASDSGRKRRSIWTEQMVGHAHSWLDTALKNMNKSDVSYDTEIIGNNLNIQFKHSLLESEQKERQLFSSFAHLIMLALSQHFKRRFINTRVILKSHK